MTGYGKNTRRLAGSSLIAFVSRHADRKKPGSGVPGMNLRFGGFIPAGQNPCTRV